MPWPRRRSSSSRKLRREGAKAKGAAQLSKAAFLAELQGKLRAAAGSALPCGT